MTQEVIEGRTQQVVALSTIRPPAELARLVDKTQQGFSELCDSIRALGVMQPLLVRPAVFQDGTEGFEVIEGNHRREAALEVGLSHVPVQVVNGVDDVTALNMTLQGNIQRKNMSAVEISKVLKRLARLNPTKTMAELGVMVGKGEAYVRDSFKLGQLDPKVLEQIKENGISASNAFVLASLPVAEIPDFLDRAKTQPSAEFSATVLNRLAAIRQAQTKGHKPAAEEFVATAKPRPLKDIIALIENSAQLTTISEKLGLPASTVKAVLEYTISLDAETVGASRAKWQAERDAREQAKKAAADERAAKKAAAEKAALQAKING